MMRALESGFLAFFVAAGGAASVARHLQNSSLNLAFGVLAETVPLGLGDVRKRPGVVNLICWRVLFSSGDLGRLRWFINAKQLRHSDFQRLRYAVLQASARGCSAFALPLLNRCARDSNSVSKLLLRESESGASALDARMDRHNFYCVDRLFSD